MSIIDDYAGIARGLEELRALACDVCACQRGGGLPSWRTPSPNCQLHAHECRHGPVINPSLVVAPRVVRIVDLSPFDLPEVWLAKINTVLVNAWCETGYTELPEVVEVEPDIYSLFKSAAFETVPVLKFLEENSLRAIRGCELPLIVRPWEVADDG